MVARMFCRTGELAGTDFEIQDDAMIGRQATNTIVLATPVVSLRHARLSRESADQPYCLEDLGSRNGTRLDGSRVKRRTRLGDLHVITFAEKHDFIFQSGGFVRAASAAEALRTPAGGNPEPGMQTVIGRGTMPRLPGVLGPVAAPEGVAVRDQTVLKTSHAPRLPDFLNQSAKPDITNQESSFVLEIQDVSGNRQVDLVDGTYEVGRSPECRVSVPDRTLSRRHARIEVLGGRVTIVDLKSENGTFVNGERVGVPTEISPGSDVTLGQYVRLSLSRKHAAGSAGRLE